MDDSEVMSTSSVSSSSSTIIRHKEAATGLDPYTGIRTYGSTPAPVGGKGLDKSINYEDTYEKLHGGKRYDHPTTYVVLLPYQSPTFEKIFFLGGGAQKFSNLHPRVEEQYRDRSIGAPSSSEKCRSCCKCRVHNA